MAKTHTATWTWRRLGLGWLRTLGPLVIVCIGGALLPLPVLAQVACPANAPSGSQCDAASDAASSDAGAAPGAALPSTRLGNPIDLVTGTKLQAETDLAVDGAALGFTRFYSSANADTNLGLGQGWRHTYLVRLFAEPGGGRAIDDSTGRRVRFAPAPEGSPGVFPGLLSSDGHLVLGDDGGHVWVVPDGRRLRFHGTFPVRIDWPGARSLSLAYRGDRLAGVTDETGRTLRLEYTPGRLGLPGFDPSEFGAHAGHLAAVVLPDGSRIEYDYDNARNLTRARFADGTSRTYRYEDAMWPSRLTGLVERTGVRFATWRYDDQGRAISSERADGVERVTLEIDAPAADGDVGTTIVTNADGARSAYTWRRDPSTGAGLLLEASGPGCATCPPTRRRYGYDALGRLVRDARLGDDGAEVSVRTFEHDALSRTVRIDETVFDADGTPITRPVERREYDGDSHRVALLARPSVDATAEHTVRTEYGAGGLPVRIVERGRSPTFELASDSPQPIGYAPIERTVTLAYEAGRLAAIDGPREDVDDTTRLERDATGRVIRIRPPASPAIAIGDHDAFGRPTTLRIGGRSPYRIERDGQGRVVRVTAGGQSVGYGHDAEGRLVSITDADGRTARLAHDAAGRLASVTDDLGRTTTLVRDAESRVIERASRGTDGALLRSLAYVFDADGRIVRSVKTATNAQGDTHAPRRIEHGRDAGGLRRTLTDLDTGATSSIDLNVVARLATLVAPDGATTRLGFDAAGRDVALTDTRGNTTRTPADDFGRRVMLDGPDVGRTIMTLDAAGNPVASKHENGTTVRYVHDAANRVVERTTPDTVTRLRWDPVDGTLVEARTSSVGPNAAASGTVERFAYDADTRLVSHERDLGGRTFATRYTRDARGRVVDKTLPDGRTLVHHYHETGPNRGTLRAITVRRWYGLGQRTLVAEIDTDARDGETGYLSAGGVRTSGRFAPNGEPVELALTDSLQLAYEFDERGRIVGIDENGAMHRYGYDGGRLVFASTPRGSTAWRFDAVGNRLAERRRTTDGWMVGDERYVYGAPGEGNRLLGTIDRHTTDAVAYHYDGTTGAPSAIGALTYTYDADRRPVEVRRDGALVARYVYNAFGERVSKAVHDGDGPPRVTHFLYEGNALAAEVNGDGELVRQYVYLDGHRPVAMLRGNALYGIHGDHLGTPRAVTDEDGRIVWRADYSAYGRATVTTEEVALPLRLPGQYADAETGTHYNYFRDYDPRTGRYLTSDPAGFIDGPNLYAYVGSTPINAIDPLGLWSRGDSLSLERIEALDDDPDAIREFVRRELSGFEDRHRFYAWAHQSLNATEGARQTDWFQLASDVNERTALGAAGMPAWATPLGDGATDFLRYAGMELAVQNVQTYITLLRGGSITGMECVAGDELDVALVGYEQRGLSGIMNEFFDQEGLGQDYDRQAVIDDLNDIANYRGPGGWGAFLVGDARTAAVVIALFPGGFDIGIEAHRIKLGQALARMQNGEAWNDPTLYEDGE